MAVLETLVLRGVRPDRVDIVKSLIAASRVKASAISSRERLLNSAQVLLGEHAPLQLQIEVVQERSTLMRLEGNIEGSTRLIEEFLSHAPPAPADVIGSLYISQAKNFAYNFFFSEAHEEAKKYSPVCIEEKPELLWDHVYCVGRIMRGEGRFEEARQCFELCLKAPGLTESRRLLILSIMADLYCELDYQYGQRCTKTAEPRSDIFLLPAGHWLMEEMRALQSRGPSKGYRRILLSLVETEIRSGHNEEARHLVDKLLCMYNSLIAPDIVDRLGHVRALIAAARVSGLEDAEKFWTDALYWNNFYNPLEEEVFTCGVIYMYMCLGQYKLGKSSGSREYLEHARRVFGKKRRQFLIPGVGTYLLDFVINEVDTLTGWNCGI